MTLARPVRGGYRAYQTRRGTVLFEDIPDRAMRRRVYDLRLMTWTAGLWLAAVAVMVLAARISPWTVTATVMMVLFLLVAAGFYMPQSRNYLVLFGYGWMIAAIRVGIARWRAVAHWISDASGSSVYMDSTAGMKVESYARLLRASTPERPLYGVDVSIPGYPTEIFLLGGKNLATVYPGDTLQGLVKVSESTRPGLSPVMFSGTGVEISERAGRLASLAATARRDIAHAVADSPAGALLQGMVTGDTSSQSPSDQQSFIDAGLSHLTAVSGANVAIVVATVGALIAAPKLRAAGSAVSIIVFVFIVGAEPSVLRAALTAGLGLCVGSLGRMREALSTVAAAAGIVILWHPPMAVHVGFILSVGATVGIIVLGTVINAALTARLPPVVGETRWGAALVMSVAVTAAAECTTLPILWLVMGSFRGASPLANVLAAPMVPPITVAGTAALVLCVLSRLVPGGWLGDALGAGLREMASWILWCLRPFAAWIRFVADTASSWTWLALDSPGWVATWGVVLYIPWVWCAWRILRRGISSRRVTIVATVTVYLVCVTARAFS